MIVVDLVHNHYTDTNKHHFDDGHLMPPHSRKRHGKKVTIKIKFSGSAYVLQYLFERTYNIYSSIRLHCDVKLRMHRLFDGADAEISGQNWLAKSGSICTACFIDDQH